MTLQLFGWLATVGIIGIFAHAVRLWFVSRPAMAPPATAHGAADGFLFAFLVPALNEARVIEHTIDRLLSLPVRHCLVLVIDDGSDDGTCRLAESHSDPRVRLLRRELPDARRGKGAALNAGFHQLLREVGDWPADKVIVGIMDADGRLDPEAPDRVAECFMDADVGAVQVAVRISNREDNVLARLQDMEFVTYTDVFQSARDLWGVAGLGGNGQFVRLAAHIDLAPDPWTDGLTEDLEQGLRLICAGWRIRYCRDVAVHQQGPGVSAAPAAPAIPMVPGPLAGLAPDSGHHSASALADRAAPAAPPDGASIAARQRAAADRAGDNGHRDRYLTRHQIQPRPA